MKAHDAAPQLLAPLAHQLASNGHSTRGTYQLQDLNPSLTQNLLQSVPGGADNVQDIYPLSPLQQGMLFYHLLNERGDTYVLSTVFELASHSQLGRLIDALQTVIERHDGLRSAVFWEHLSRPVQVVQHRAVLPVQEMILDPERNALEQLKERMRPECQRLDLRRAPLVRLLVASNQASALCYAVLQVHHLVCDHQSLRMLVAEVIACVEGREESLPTPVPYRTFVEQALTDATAEAEGAESFFREKLGDVAEATAPFGLLNVHGDGSQIEEVRQELDREVSRRIRVQASRWGVTPARLFHSAWALVVAHTSAREDVVFGTVLLAGRRRIAARGQCVLGMSVNTLPLRLRIENISVQELVSQTQREITELLKYESVPLTLAQRCSGLAESAPLFTTLMNYRHSAFTGGREHTDSSEIRVLYTGEAWTNYPITVLVDDVGDGFALTMQTDVSIDPRRMTGYLHTAVQSLVEALDHAPHTPALQLPILPESERQQVLEEYNATEVPYPREKRVHELFEEQVQRTPNAVAVMYEGVPLSYADLNGRANQLARHLQARGIGPDQLVGICVERSLEMVVGLLSPAS